MPVGDACPGEIGLFYLFHGAYGKTIHYLYNLSAKITQDKEVI